MAKTRLSAAEAAAKWGRRTQGAAQDYQSGVQRATGWSAGALNASARRDAGLQAAIADHRIDAGIQRVGDAGWKDATLTKGVKNWAPATQASVPKMASALQTVYGMLDQAAAATQGIDTTTLEGRLQKAAAHARSMAEQAAARKRGM